MVYIQNGNIENLISKCKEKKVVCFGAGEHLVRIFERFSNEELYRYVENIIDNKKELWGKVKYYKEKEYSIVSFEELVAMARRDALLIIITSHWYINEIIMQMDQEDVLDGVEVFVGDLLDFDFPMADYPSFEVENGSEEKIPRVIHYCWFGGGEIPAEIQAYMESWKKYCPDYDIRRWDESNYDVTKNQYMRQAYERGKWAFVSDYARIEIVYRYGGIYLDCDVELLKPLDVFLQGDMYCGFEDDRHINLGLGFGAAAGHPYLASLLHYYENLSFINDDGKMNLIPCPTYQTEVIGSYGILGENRFQKTDKITAYPTEVFSPYSYWGIGNVTDKSYSIHHFTASWEDDDKKKEFARWKDLVKKLYERIQKQ